jgi:predicted short-subunit dehydrogenase-like oxidoreductase (DUF2520 family)
MTVGLIAAGATAKACVTSMRLAERLGPVAASSYRVASRIANTLRAGYAVKSYAEVKGANPVVVCVPDSALPRTIQSVSTAGIQWKGVVALLYSTRRDSREIRPLREAGAFTGSMRPLEGVPDRFLVEGDKQSVAVARRIVQQARGKIVELNGNTAGAYLAAVSFSSSLFIPMLEASIECLRMAGVGSMEASRLAETLFERSLRAHRHGGRKSWSGPLAAGDEEEIRRELEALESHNPLLANYYREVCRFALELFGRHPKLLRSLVREQAAR